MQFSLQSCQDRKRHIDTQVIIYANRDKVVLHCYNTTQLILVNGHGYARLVETFLKPYFESKIELNIEEIKSYNESALVALEGGKMVKRSSIKYKGSPPYLWCTKCDHAARSRTALVKHKKSPSSSFVLPVHQSTRNNSISEGLELMNDQVTLEEECKEEEDETVTTTSRELLSIEDKSEQLKYTCLDCDYKTKDKSNIGKHMVTVHEQLEKEANFICGICNYEPLF